MTFFNVRNLPRSHASSYYERIRFVLTQRVENTKKNNVNS